MTGKFLMPMTPITLHLIEGSWLSEIPVECMEFNSEIIKHRRTSYPKNCLQTIQLRISSRGQIVLFCFRNRKLLKLIIVPQRLERRPNSTLLHISADSHSPKYETSPLPSWDSTGKLKPSISLFHVCRLKTLEFSLKRLLNS